MDDLKHAYDLQSHPVSEETTAYVSALRAENDHLRALVRELADDLEQRIEQEYAGTLDYPVMKRKHERDITVVREARAALEGGA